MREGAREKSWFEMPPKANYRHALAIAVCQLVVEVISPIARVPVPRLSVCLSVSRTSDFRPSLAFLLSLSRAVTPSCDDN